MGNVLLGFSVILVVIAVGYVVGRIGLLGEHAPHVLARLAFFVLSPCLMFTIMAHADIHQLFSGALIASALAAAAAALGYVIIARLVFKRDLSALVVGALSAGYCNAGNIGLAVSAYVLGDAAYVAPVMVFQMLVFAPVALILLDTATRGYTSVAGVAVQSVKNPMLVGALLGVLCALFELQIPAVVLDPFELIGAAAVPLMLLNFGISLHGQRVLQRGSAVADVLVASGFKLFVMPIAAWGIASWLGLEGDLLRAIVVLAALPTAQNVFNYAQRYDSSVIVARDSITITTVASIPVLVVVSALLG